MGLILSDSGYHAGMSSFSDSGTSYPLGTLFDGDGVNFCVFSRNAEAIELVLFDSAEADRPSRVIPFDPKRNRTFYYWHLYVPGLRPGQLYGYRAHGPHAPHEGHWFDSQKVLLDPYAKVVMDNPRYTREAAKRPGDNSAHCLKSVVADRFGYDWEGDTPLNRPYGDTLIYELHVGGFTRHPSSGVKKNWRGTYLGLIEKIPYLNSLGITAVELLPVQHFDAQDAPNNQENYWGYSPIAFFAPHRGYCAHPADPLAPMHEFRDMVKALHRAGIEVILDVVFNHTAEGDHTGPTLSFRGLENRAYYILDDDPARYKNYSGCGNAINAGNSVVRRMIVDCLKHWVLTYHVDGFRFDLASVLARDKDGVPLKDPPLLWEIESDPVLAGTKIIAEAWDAAGLYQVGSFIGHRWAEWNGHFRDDVRRFLKGDNGYVPALAARLTGSRDVYTQPKREPNRSINFVTGHDGFTLNDLVSYNTKHNQANGEDNRDGNNDNHSWNCGHEGPTPDPHTEALRARQLRNFWLMTLVAQGTPMMLMGDEVRRTQHGNNNAYCQNTPLSWFDWHNTTHHADLLRFVQRLIHFTQTRSVFRQEIFWETAPSPTQTYIEWHGTQPNQPDWADYSHSLAATLHNPLTHERVYMVFSAFWEPLVFHIPALPAGWQWHRVADTALASPHDIADPGTEPRLLSLAYRVQPRSSMMLLAKPLTP